MIKKYLAICVCLFAVADVLAQSRAKTVKQPPEVIEAYRVANEFQRIFAENLDFGRAFEATFTKDPNLRREIAITEAELGRVDADQVDDATLIAIYKTQAQILLLMVPLLYAAEGGHQPVVFPPPIEEIFTRNAPRDEKAPLQPYLAQLQQDLKVFRAHFDKLAATNPVVAGHVRQFKKNLLKPLQPPAHVVKPLTAYSNTRILSPHEEYYKISNYAVIREQGRMRIIGFKLYHIAW